jgi:hypothetical protein
MLHEGDEVELTATSDPDTERLEDLELEQRHSPGSEAFALGQRVSEPDLSVRSGRWPEFGDRALGFEGSAAPRAPSVSPRAAVRVDPAGHVRQDHSTHSWGCATVPTLVPVSMLNDATKRSVPRSNSARPIRSTSDGACVRQPVTSMPGSGRPSPASASGQASPPGHDHGGAAVTVPRHAAVSADVDKAGVHVGRMWRVGQDVADVCLDGYVGPPVDRPCRSAPRPRRQRCVCLRPSRGCCRKERHAAGLGRGRCMSRRTTSTGCSSPWGRHGRGRPAGRARTPTPRHTR